MDSYIYCYYEPLFPLTPYISWMIESLRHANKIVIIIMGWHGMETLLALLALCEGNPSFSGGFPSQEGQ